MEETIPHLDPSYVEYFFDVFVDNEIDQKMLVEREKKVKDIYAPINDELEEC